MALRLVRLFAIRLRRWVGRMGLGALAKQQQQQRQGNERLALVVDNSLKPLSRTTKAAFGLGHVLNDLAAAMWFSYTLLFLQRVARFDPLTAGTLLLLGQVVDALMTPVFGLLVDRHPRRKAWHVLGSLMVLLSFPLLFGSFLGNEDNSMWTMFVYVLSIIVFQAGWAASQISHLSMIPALTSSPLLRAELTAIRYSAQVGAALVVFVVTWIVLPTGGVDAARLGPQDSYKFRNIVVVLTLFGGCSTILFHAFLKARLLEVWTPQLESWNPKPELEKRNKAWLTTGMLGKVALLYVASRLFITLATVYLPLYVEETGLVGRQALATVPMISYGSSFITAFLLKYINKSCGTKVCYLVGALCGVGAAACVELAGGRAEAMYSGALLIGAGSSITMVTALSITAELIGPRTESSAYVYSIVTFLDKVITGLVVLFIEKWRCLDKELCPNYNRDSLAAVCAASMALGLITLAFVSRCIPN